MKKLGGIRNKESIIGNNSNLKYEYGGCLPLETIDTLNNPFLRYINSTWNSGRSAIYAAIKDYGADTVWLPYYLCPTVKQFLKKWNILIKEYHITEKYEPILENYLQKNEMILWTNWYGCMEKSLIKKIQKIFGKQGIIDNSQAIFSFPDRESESYYVYSCRKFLGVPEGSYLIQKDLKPKKTKEIMKIEGWEYLIRCKFFQSNNVYSLYSEHEKKMHDQFQDMSELTKQYLNGVNWIKIKEKRKKNMEVLHEKLKRFHLLDVDFQSDSCFMYPFLSATDGLREHLIQKQIYVPRWWKHMLQLPNLLPHEYEWAKKIVPLPIDQRYDEEDMEWIANQVICEL